MRRRLMGIALGCTLALNPGIGIAQDCPELVSRHPYGLNQAVAAAGTTAYVGNGAALMVVDLSDPATPEVIGRFDLPSFITDIAVSGDRVYVSTYQAIHAINMTDPSSPVEIGFFGCGYNCDSLAASGSTVYSLKGSGIGWPGSLMLIDFRFPGFPPIVGEWRNDQYLGPLGVVDGHVLLGMSDGISPPVGIAVLDFPSPSSEPTQLGYLELEDVAGGMDIQGDLAYFAGRSGFRIVDVSDPSGPFVVGGLDLPDDVSGVAVNGALAFVGGSGSGLHVVDISDPSMPLLSGSYLPPDWSFSDVAAIPGFGLVATWAEGGVRVVDATEPAEPTEIARVATPGYSLDAAFSDGVLAIAAGRRGLRLVDVSDPETPVDLVMLELVGGVQDVDAIGETVFAVGSRLTIVDVHDPAEPIVVGEAPTVMRGKGIKVIGDFAYIADEDFGLRIFDVAIPSAPIEVGQLNLGSHFGQGIDVSGQLAVLKGPETVVIDVTDAANPVETARIPAFSSVSEPVLSGSRLVFAHLDSLRIYDLSDPANPVEVATVPVSGGVISAVGVSGSVAYLATDVGGIDHVVEVVDIGDLSNPTFLGARPGAGFAWSIAFGDEQVFVTSYECGFDTFALCQGPLFADGFGSGDTTAWSSAVP